MSYRSIVVTAFSLAWLYAAQDSMRFEKSKLVLPEGGTQDAELVFLPRQQVLAVECAYHGGFRIPYNKVQRLTQSLGERQVRTGAVVALGAAGLLMPKRAHYLYIDYEEGGAVRQLGLRLPGGQWQRVLDVARAEIGKPVAAQETRGAPPPVAALPVKPEPPATTGEVTVTSQPANADIEINGLFSGTTPSTFKLPPGEYLVAVKKDGHSTWERNLEIKAGGAIGLNAELALGGPATGMAPATVPAVAPTPVPAVSPPPALVADQSVPKVDPGLAQPVTAPQTAKGVSSERKTTTYTFTNLSSEKAAPYGKEAQAVEEALVEQLRKSRLERTESVSGACCKLVLKLLDARSRLADMSLVTQRWNATIIATVTVQDAAMQDIYSKGYQAQSETPIGWLAPALMSGTARKLAEKIAGDEGFTEALSGRATTNAKPTAEIAEIQVSSNPDNAEVEVNGAVFGNTPATLKLVPGEYRVVVRKGSYAPWERNLKIGPGAAIRLRAVLGPSQTGGAEQAAPQEDHR